MPPAAILHAARPPRASRPFVSLNLALTADGKLAPSHRRFIPFSSPRDHQHLLELRARADAVLCGARTVDLAPVKMDPGDKRFQTLRLARGLAEFNLRIIMTGRGTLNPQAEIFKHRFSPIIVLTTDQASRAARACLAKIADDVQICGEKAFDLPFALAWLKKQWNVKKLLCEGGGETNALFLEAGVVDELNLTFCPFIFGGRSAPTLADGAGFPRLANASQWKMKSHKKIGDELFLVYSALKRRNKTSRAIQAISDRPQ